MSINIKRLEADLNQLASIGKTADGITRAAFSDADMEARSWLVTKMEECGLMVSVDPAGNIRGKLENGTDATLVACGSHIDSVNNAGHLDGTLGVLSGLEALRSLKEDGVELSHPLEVIAFSDEEGRFGGMLGSRALAGVLEQDEIETATDVNGNKLADCMTAQGFDTGKVLEAKEKPENFKAFVELHIEQGPVLEAKDIPIGVVKGITGLFKWEVSFTGQANHAGTTPMNMRKDAFQGLTKFAAKIDDILAVNGTEGSKTTIGKCQLYPGSPNVVPGKCVFTLEVRDTDQQVLNGLEKTYREILEKTAKENSLEVGIEELSNIRATPCDADIVKLICSVANDQGIENIVMPSGAAHDAQYMAGLTKTAMIFVPSIGGVSHNPRENTSLEDIETGANLLKATLYELAK